MRIESSTIAMSSNRSYSAEISETQTVIDRCYGSDGELIDGRVSTTSYQISQLELEGGAAVYTSSAGGLNRAEQHDLAYGHGKQEPVEDLAARQRQKAAWLDRARASSNCWIGSFTAGIDEDPQIKFMKRLLELLEQFTGKRYSRSLLPKWGSTSGAAVRYSAASVSMRYQQTAAAFSSRGSAVQGEAVNGQWTRQTVRSGFAAGQENTAFASKGTVLTSDGRAIDFNVSVELSRSFAAAYEVTTSEQAVVFTDPLVINMDTDAPALSDVSFYFDLDADGAAEEIAALDSSSGLLALDKNGDGVINDGSELFGARTGDGFGELAAYDEDGNGWIDENDDVFAKLSVWVKCGTEDARLLSLADADVGAIFLGSQSTQFSLTDNAGATQAMIRSTGVYLKESGQVGTVQHIDFRT